MKLKDKFSKERLKNLNKILKKYNNPSEKVLQRRSGYSIGDVSASLRDLYRDSLDSLIYASNPLYPMPAPAVEPVIPMNYPNIYVIPDSNVPSNIAYSVSTPSGTAGQMYVSYQTYNQLQTQYPSAQTQLTNIEHQGQGLSSGVALGGAGTLDTNYGALQNYQQEYESAVSYNAEMNRLRQQIEESTELTSRQLLPFPEYNND